MRHNPTKSDKRLAINWVGAIAITLIISILVYKLFVLAV